jgi:hypothetical protein
MPMTFNASDVLRKLEILGSSAIPAATKRALTRSLSSGSVAIARAVSRDMGLNVGVVKGELRSEVVDTDEGMVGRLSISGKRIPLIDFKARGPEPSRGRGKVTASTGGGRKPYPGAFIARVGTGGHRGVFQRAGASSSRKSRGAWSPNLPIVELKGPSLPHVFYKQREVAIARFAEQFPKELQREVTFALKRTASS